jgi:hypothetical protein
VMTLPLINRVTSDDAGANGIGVVEHPARTAAPRAPRNWERLRLSQQACTLA